MTDAAAGTAGVGVLVVCTANVCRSPLAAAILHRAWRDLPIGVGSAGVRAMTGAPVCAVSQEEFGAPIEGAARELTPALVREADLVLAMEREQRSAVVRLLPGSQPRVFTLREAAALLEGLVERGARIADPAALAPAMHALRGVVVPQPDPVPRRRWWQRPLPPQDPLTIEDGHGLAPDEHRAAADRVAAAADRVASAVLTLSGRAAPRPRPTP